MNIFGYLMRGMWHSLGMTRCCCPFRASNLYLSFKPSGLHTLLSIDCDYSVILARCEGGDDWVFGHSKCPDLRGMANSPFKGLRKAVEAVGGTSVRRFIHVTSSTR